MNVKTTIPIHVPTKVPEEVKQSQINYFLKSEETRTINMSKNAPIDKDIIIAVENELLNAMTNCDLQKLDELLHEDLLFNIPNGQTITKALDLETYSSGNMKIKKMASSEQEINIIGDNAIVSVTIEMKGMYFDHILDGKYRFIRVWKSFNNSYKVIAGSSIQL